MPQPTLYLKVQGSLSSRQTCPWSGTRGVSNLAGLTSYADWPPHTKAVSPLASPIDMRLPAHRDTGALLPACRVQIRAAQTCTSRPHQSDQGGTRLLEQQLLICSSRLTCRPLLETLSEIPVTFTPCRRLRQTHLAATCTLSQVVILLSWSCSPTADDL